jgi:hypothetical protein
MHVEELIGRERPILLKKSAMVSTAENYALEIEIFSMSRGFRAQISRSCAEKRRFQQPVCGQSGRTDFFNTIGQKQSFKAVYLHKRGRFNIKLVTERCDTMFLAREGLKYMHSVRQRLPLR